MTFKEFAMFVLNKSENLSNMVNNEHWTPITKLCHPCLINYTLVGKSNFLPYTQHMLIKNRFFFNMQQKNIWSQIASKYYKCWSLDGWIIIFQKSFIKIIIFYFYCLGGVVQTYATAVIEVARSIPASDQMCV